MSDTTTSPVPSPSTAPEEAIAALQVELADAIDVFHHGMMGAYLDGDTAESARQQAVRDLLMRADAALQSATARAVQGEQALAHTLDCCAAICVECESIYEDYSADSERNVIPPLDDSSSPSGASE